MQEMIENRPGFEKIPAVRRDMPRLPEQYEPRTIVQLLKTRAQAVPNRLAIIAESPIGPQARLTYAQLAWEVDRLADGLRRMGLKRGDHLAILLPNSAGKEFVLTTFGAMRLGVVPVPLNTRYAALEQVYSINHFDCRGIVFSSDYAETMHAIRDRLPQVEYFIEVGTDCNSAALDWREIQKSGNPASIDWPNIHEDDIAVILLTSGTTGHPKGVVLSHANSIATAVADSGAINLIETDVLMSAMPMFTSSGLNFNLVSALYVGASMIIEPNVDPLRTLERMAQERVTSYVAVPAVYIYMLEVYDPQKHDLPQLRVLDYGGAAMGREIIRRLKKAFPNADLRHTYGMTEAGPSGTFLHGDFALEKLGSIGKAMPLNEIRVVRPDDSPVAPGEMGEICIRGPTVMRGYYNDRDATANAIRNGWLYSGDLGTIDSDGFLYYLDRSKDIIIRGGFNIGSMEVENALYDHPDVKEVAVVAVPHPKLGEDLFAFVVLRGARTPSTEELRVFLAERIADYKIPRRYAFVEKLPRNPMGKILKLELREQARASG